MGCLLQLSSNNNEEVLNYLKRNELEATFLIGNVRQFGLYNDKSIRRCGDYFGYIENEKLKGIIAFYNLGSCIPHFETINSIPFFVDIINEKNVGSLLGMSKFILPLYDKIKDYNNVKSYSDDNYLINKSFKPFRAKDVVVVSCESVNRDAAIEFIIEANKIGFSREITPEEALKTIKERGREEDEVFVIKDGKIVSRALIQTCTDSISQIGGVYTSRDYRGNGYCKAAVSELCKRIIKRGKVPSLMVRKDNSPAVKAYSALGFQYYDDYIIVTFNKNKK